MNDEQQKTVWRKSTRCGSSACVEIAMTESAILMRDSKDLNVPALHFSKNSWVDFVSAIRNGELQRS